MIRVRMVCVRRMSENVHHYFHLFLCISSLDGIFPFKIKKKKKKPAEVLGRRAPMLSHDSALNETTVLALRRSRRSLIGVKAKKHMHPSVEARRRCAPSDTVTGFG